MAAGFVQSLATSATAMRLLAEGASRVYDGAMFPSDSTKPVAWRAKWVFPVASPPIQNGLVVVHRGRIVHVGPAPAGDSAVDWGDVALLPALVNAHTHLEFSGFRQPLGDASLAFPDWIRQVVAWRRERAATANDAGTLPAIEQGVDECFEAGVACLGEIATSDDSYRAMNAAGMHGIVFWELIGLAPDRAASLLARAEQILADPSDKPGLRRGLSPHAPYTVHPDLLRGLVELSASRQVPLAMHLAETSEELQLLRFGSGPFVDLLRDLQAWQPDAIPRASRPMDYLRVLAQASRALVVHGNYLDDDEIQFLGQERDKLSLVYCPRTHAHFGHPDYPLTRCLAKGVRVVLGTDSRASNPDLNLLADLRFAAGCHVDVAPETWLRMVTLDAATALGMENELGSLRVGKLASLAMLSLPSRATRDPWELLWEGMCEGKLNVIS